MQDRKEDTRSRRAFFRLAGLGGGAAGAAAAGLVSGGAEAAEAPPSPTAAGDRETQHVKTYYELARF